MEDRLRWWCLGVMMFGVVLATGGFAATDRLAVMLLTLFGREPVAMAPPLHFATGLMGAVTLGWGASLLAVTLTTTDIAPDVRVTLWRRIGWAVLGWYAVDSIISIASGFWPNAVSNSVLLAWFWWAARE